MTYPVINLASLTLFLVFLARVSGIFISAPLFGARNVPPRVRIGVAIVLAYIFYELLQGHTPPLPDTLNWMNLGLLIILEVLVGLLIGFTAMLVFLAIQFAGHIIDIMTGMQMASVFDPATSAQQSLFGQFQYILALLLFLAFNGHHFIIHALFQSFSLIPIGSLSFSGGDPLIFMKIVGTSFSVGFQLAAPIMAMLFLIDFSLGIIAKGVPQMNVFVTGMPIKSLVGIMGLFIVSVYFGAFFSHIPKMTYIDIISVLRSI
jgi:flagellar biosynthetic protein FliR